MPSSGLFCNSFSSFANLFRAAPAGPAVPYKGHFHISFLEVVRFLVRLRWSLPWSNYRQWLMLAGR